jgi:alkyl hydroperoxide reductase subunit AhpC
MLLVGLEAPPFACSAVVARRLLRLGWHELHAGRVLVLVFETLGDRAGADAELFALGNAVVHSGRPRAGFAVVCRNPLEEVLDWVNRLGPEGGADTPAFPLILDPNGRIGGLYELSAGGRGPSWGQFLIDPSGVLRQVLCCGYPVRPSAEEVLRAVRASGFPAETELWN